MTLADFDSGYTQFYAQFYVRFGPNVGMNRLDSQLIADHESRQTDQWAIATLVAGPLALPIAYLTDIAFFPFERNHFERAAGLADGGYVIPPDSGPAPLWRGVGVLILVVLLTARRRIRWLYRIVVTGRSTFLAAHPCACLLHS